MKLTAILTAALPLLAAAAPRSFSDGSHQDDGEFPGNHPQHGDYAVAPGAGDHRSPTEMKHSPNDGASDMVELDSHKIDHGDMTEHLEQRDLEARVDNGSIDHYIEECNVGTWITKDQICVRNLVIPKGKTNGGCVARMQKDAIQGTMHLLESNVMCRYYEKPGCKGEMSGPYSNVQCDYSWGSYFYGQFIYNPQSVQCEMIGFSDKSRQPVNPPRADPLPGNNNGYNCTIGIVSSDDTWLLQPLGGKPKNG